MSEFGFDVLRDRLATSVAGLIAGAPDVALIDEADSVLVDEALVPLVLAGAADGGAASLQIADIARQLRPGRDYRVDEDGRSVHLTNEGTRAVEAALGGIDLYAGPHLAALTEVNVALYAEALLQRDVDYLVRDGKVELINASRGRVARRQRWPDGLHAAVEAKEGLATSESGEILDSITIQSLLKRYPTVCGMTGTAVAVGEQLREFYGLEIAVIPPHRPCVRIDEPDRLYVTARQKEEALADHIAAVHAGGRPVGRQGDPGSSVFFASMQDELVTRYVPDAPLPAATSADGATLDDGARETVAHALRVAEPRPGMGGSPELPGRPAGGDPPARARTRARPAERIPPGGGSRLLRPARGGRGARGDELRDRARDGGRGRPRRGRTQAAHRHLDLPGARQPVWH